MEPTLDTRPGHWLTATGVLSEPDLARAEERQRATGERLVDAAVKLGYCTAEEVAQSATRAATRAAAGRAPAEEAAEHVSDAAGTHGVVEAGASRQQVANAIARRQRAS